MTTVHELIRSADVRDDVIEATLADGELVAVHALAVRDSCSCSECRLPSGQRLYETHLALRGAAPTAVHVEDTGLAVAFDDGHVVHLSLLDLERAVSGWPKRQHRLWDASLTHDLSRHSFTDVAGDRAARRAWLGDVARYGVGLVVRAPLRNGTVAEVAELFSPVRVTNYGRIFDVQVKVDMTNLADSALPLSLHTDNTYRVPQPTVQLLQCLSSSIVGGETILVDGFHAVEVLRRDDPDALELLATTPIRYAYGDSTTSLESDVPVVELGDDGAPVALRINNRSKGIPVGPPGLVRQWYAAYFRLWDVLDQPELQSRFRLEPGEIVVFDNWRVLHGRGPFGEGGTRRLQGCYADRDALLSTLAVLERTEET